jgi:hypothetical protein
MGGGATYDLVWRVVNSYPNVNVDYTAYVDAITSAASNLEVVTGKAAERRMPLRSKFHDNYYQRIDNPMGNKTTLELNPNAVLNNVNVNVDQEWKDKEGNSIGHTEIDDVEDLWIEVVAHMHDVMTR